MTVNVGGQMAGIDRSLPIPPAPRPERLRQAAAAAHTNPALADTLDWAAAALTADLDKWGKRLGQRDVAAVANAKYAGVLSLAGEVLAGYREVAA